MLQTLKMGCCHPAKDIPSNSNSNSIRLSLRDIPFLTSQLQLQEPIGSGHYSEVRKALTAQGELVAVKCIPLDQMGKEIRLISREVHILMTAQHANIVRYFGCYRDSEMFYMSMELCAGGSLREKIDAEGRLEEAWVQAKTREILQALAYLHSLQIAHRDIKPENILFDADQHVKLADFGLSRALLAPDHLTVVGTPYYLAPEMIAGKYTPICDMWSLGVVLYFALTNKLPFQGEDFGGLFNQIRCLNITYWGTCSENAVSFIKALLARTARERLTAAQALNHAWLV